MNLSLSGLGPKEGGELVKGSKSSQEQAIISNLNRGNFRAAELNAHSAALPEEAWNNINTAADNKINEISPLETDKKRKKLSEKEAAKEVKAAEDKKILEYGQEHMPLIDTTSEAQQLLKENDHIINDLLKSIEAAKEEAMKSMISKPVSILALPLIADIYGIFKGRNLKKHLNKMEKLYAKLKDPKYLSDRLKADKISPNAGHIHTIVGTGIGVGGFAVAGIGAVAAAPVAIGAGIGVAVAGGINVLIGQIRQIFNFANVRGTYKSLEELETNVKEMRTKNDAALSQVGGINNAYVNGARENLAGMMGKN